MLETEEVLDEVLRRVAPGRARRWLVPAFVAAAAATVVWVQSATPPPNDAEFASRGTGEGAVLSVQCIHGQPATATCTPGARLAFRLEPPRGEPYFALFMVAPGGAVTWYFPDPAGTTPMVRDATASAPWSRAARLAPGLEAGTYSLVGVFSDRAMTRDALKQAIGDDLKAGPGLTLVRRSIQVEAAR